MNKNRTNWLPSLLEEMRIQESTSPSNHTLRPAVNITESDDKFSLSLVIPGFKKDELAIELDKDVLAISSEVEASDEETTEQFTRKEFVLTSFKRSFNLPKTVDQTAINADYSNGILNISLPKKEEALPQPKRSISLN